MSVSRVEARRACATGVLVVLGLAAAAGCSSGGGDSGSAEAGGSSDGGLAAGAADLAPAPAPARQATSVRTGTGAGSAPAAVQTRAVVRTAQLSVTTRHLGRALGDVDSLLAAVGGSVDHADTSNDRAGRAEASTLVLRVPVGRFDTVRRSLARLGTLTTSTESEKDVTTQVIDTRERVQTLQNSLDRLQRFQRSADDVADLIRFEQEITTRTAELQSIRAQQAYLADQTSMATITVDLATPRKVGVRPGPLDHAGFLPGLTGGWHALTGVLVVALTAVGALLPFVPVAALVGLLVWILVRWRRRRTPAEEAPAA